MSISSVSSVKAPRIEVPLDVKLHEVVETIATAAKTMKSGTDNGLVTGMTQASVGLRELKKIPTRSSELPMGFHQTPSLNPEASELVSLATDTLAKSLQVLQVAIATPQMLRTQAISKGKFNDGTSQSSATGDFPQIPVNPAQQALDYLVTAANLVRQAYIVNKS